MENDCTSVRFSELSVENRDGPRLRTSDDKKSDETTARADECGRVGSGKDRGVDGKKLSRRQGRARRRRRFYIIEAV